MDEPKLLPCPFCGSHDIEVQGKPAILDALDSVCCNECTADAPYPVWNTRALPQPAAVESVEVRGLRSDSDVSLIKPSHGEQVRDGSLSRESLTLAYRLITKELETLANGSAIDRFKSAQDEFRSAIAAAPSAGSQGGDV